MVSKNLHVSVLICINRINEFKIDQKKYILKIRNNLIVLVILNDSIQK